MFGFTISLEKKYHKYVLSIHCHSRLQRSREHCTLFEKIHPVCETIGDAYEVLFVDDGSLDETFAVLSELSKQFPQLVVIRFQKNTG
ncbi:glycosyltransferase [Candidatus Poribacteria bacterium]|nr:glycosyltransferase [Candidatus Poribacteria bacterium]